jgi:hypothetical protein
MQTQLWLETDLDASIHRFPDSKESFKILIQRAALLFVQYLMLQCYGTAMAVAQRS